MQPFDQEYYVFVPAKDQIRVGTLYTLAPGPSGNAKQFVLVPYAHPKLKAVQAEWYSVLSEQAVELPVSTAASKAPIQLKAGLSKAEYLNRIQTLKQHIQRGDIYEINYCLQFFAEQVDLDVFHVFEKLRALSMAPYSMLVKLKDDYILCASPELFLKKTGTTLISKPIKGTARRSSNAIEDEQLKETLRTSLKERTENVMAVDVARNDLSILATKGSVTVPNLFDVETFKTVHQLVSTVHCELKAGTTFDEIIQATFPMASMTGAPKISAMNFIEQEENFERGAYSGCMGFVSQNDFELAVIIRSIFYNSTSQHLHIAVGGAITHLCEPEKEYEECLLKAKALVEALGAGLG
jgi:para-aminobenzoate synthetase component 1